MTTDGDGELNCRVGRVWRFHCPELAAALTPSIDETMSPLDVLLAITEPHSPCGPPPTTSAGAVEYRPAYFSEKWI